MEVSVTSNKSIHYNANFKAMHVFIKYNSTYHGVDKGTAILLFKGVSLYLLEISFLAC